MGKTTLRIGIVLLLISLGWWQLHFGAIADARQAAIDRSRYQSGTVTSIDYLPCLYQESFLQCIYAGRVRAGTPPRPPVLLFWVAVITTMAGVILRTAGGTTTSHPPSKSE